MKSELSALEAEHARLLAGPADSRVVRADGMIGEPLPRYEIQEKILKNLKKIVEARDRFQLNHGRAPTSIDDIIGITGQFKRLVPADGEDYASLSLEPGGVLAVTTLSGVTVKYGNGTSDAATTPVEYPPELARVKALAAALRPAARVAYEAYRMANQGKDPDDANALLPFFSNPRDRAAYLEFHEANRIANGR